MERGGGHRWIGWGRRAVGARLQGHVGASNHSHPHHRRHLSGNTKLVRSGDERGLAGQVMGMGVQKRIVRRYEKVCHRRREGERRGLERERVGK